MSGYSFDFKLSGNGKLTWLHSWLRKGSTHLGTDRQLLFPDPPEVNGFKKRKGFFPLLFVGLKEKIIDKHKYLSLAVNIVFSVNDDALNRKVVSFQIDSQTSTGTHFPLSPSLSPVIVSWTLTSVPSAHVTWQIQFTGETYPVLQSKAKRSPIELERPTHSKQNNT